MSKTPLALVTGGAGFIGSHLCEALVAQGTRVVCVDSLRTGSRLNVAHLARESRLDFIEADVSDPPPRAVLQLVPQLTHIYNLACPASPVHYQADPEHTLMTSVLGTRYMLRLAEQSGARFLQTSTSEVYGDPEAHPQRESYLGSVNCTGPRACYDEGKRAAEALCFDFARGGRAEVRVARIFNTYGPRMQADDGRIVSNVISQVLDGRDVTIYGDGTQTRSFCYVDDMVDGLLRLMRHDGPAPGPVNLGNPAEITIRRLVDEVLELAGTTARLVHLPLPVDDPRRRRPDISRARQVLGWEPRVPLRQGLRKTLAWFSAQVEQRTLAATLAPVRELARLSDQRT